MTNYEKIKNISIDKMAEMLKFLLPGYCSECILDAKGICTRENFLQAINPCASAIKQWLQAESEVE